MSVLIPPGDVAADHAGPLGVAGVVGAAQGEVARRREVSLDAVAGSWRWSVEASSTLLAVAQAPTRASFLAQVRAGVVQHDRQADLARAQGAQAAQEGEQLAATLARRDVARSEEHTSELQSLRHLVCRLL